MVELMCDIVSKQKCKIQIVFILYIISKYILLLYFPFIFGIKYIYKYRWYSSSILVIWCEQMTHWKSPWCWERLRAEGEEGVRGWDAWTTSLMQWAWTWPNSGRWWRTGRPGVPQSMVLQRVRHDWAMNSYIYLHRDLYMAKMNKFDLIKLKIHSKRNHWQKDNPLNWTEYLQTIRMIKA